LPLINGRGGDVFIAGSGSLYSISPANAEIICVININTQTFITVRMIGRLITGRFRVVNGPR
jgi:hypothetical protein